MASRTFLFKILLFIAMLSIGTSQAADDIRGLLFGEADAALTAANEARAKILAPISYEKAIEYHEDASNRLKKGHSIERIKKDLANSTKFARKALESANIAKVTLAKTILARDDALRVKADKYSKDDWEDGADNFLSAVRRLESGSLKKAMKSASRAEKYFRSAELDAIKINYLTEARQLIAKAYDDDIDDYAPLTLTKAKLLLKEAEKELSENRYDLDRPRSLARNAHYEASHAIYIAKLLKPVDDDDVTEEQLVLALEKPVTDIAGSLDLVAALDRPVEALVETMVSSISALQKKSHELNVRLEEITALEKSVDKLEKRLGIQSQTLAKQEENRKRFQRVEQQFTTQEAIVLTQGNNILIRLVGLSFRPAQAAIEPQYFALLKKLENILEVYPNATAVLEGHTDSFGGDAANLTLSQQRAESVRSYLLANIDKRNPNSIRSVGYGESRPIGNNETFAGRAKNRRIDLVIKML